MKALLGVLLICGCMKAIAGHEKLENQTHTRSAGTVFRASGEKLLQSHHAHGLGAYHHQLFSNGMEVLLSSQPDSPTTHILLKVLAGHHYESNKKAGLVDILVNILNEQAKCDGDTKLARELKRLGSKVQYTASNLYVDISVTSPNNAIDATLNIVFEHLSQPIFLGEDFKRFKQEQLQLVMQNQKNASYLAKSELLRLLYGDYIAGLPSSGTIDTLGSLTSGDIQLFYKTQFKPYGAKLSIISSIHAPKIIENIRHHSAKWKGAGLPFKHHYRAVYTAPKTIYFLTKDGADTVNISMGKKTIVKDILGEFFELNLIHTILGKVPDGRLSRNLLGDKRFNNLSSNLMAGRYSGYYIINADVDKESALFAIGTLITEIHHFAKDGLTQKEYLSIPKYESQRDKIEYRKPMKNLRFISTMLEYNLSPKFVQMRDDIAQDVSWNYLNGLAQTHFDVNKMVMVVVGKAEVLSELINSGYKVIELSDGLSN